MLVHLYCEVRLAAAQRFVAVAFAMVAVDVGEGLGSRPVFNSALDWLFDYFAADWLS